MNNSILFVDDDPNILSAFKRTLHNKFVIDTAENGEQGLEKLMTNNSFAAVVADMRMPKMDGVTFLQHVRKFNKNIIRIMLTGNADIQTAIDAVNDGRVFRFLTKPCPQQILVTTLESALEQYRLINAEQELLKKTLTGAVKVLVEILSMVNPAAFSRASRIRKISGHIVKQMGLHNIWLYEVSAMLSQIGCVSLPSSLLNKVYSQIELTAEEKRLYSSHPIIGYNLLSKIPRLEAIASIIKNQDIPFSQFPVTSDTGKEDTETTGAQILKAATDFDFKLISGISKKDAVEELKCDINIYNPKIVEALESYHSIQELNQKKIVRVKDLIYGMVALHDIKANNGILLAAKGQEITYPVIAKLQNFARHVGIEEPFEVLMPEKNHH
ncbi:response regulator [bacterium]|nr:response regulator [bacterium]